MPVIRQLASYAVALPPLSTAVRRYSRQAASVFMLHRFERKDGGGYPLQSLRCALQYLRRNEYPIVTIDDVVWAYREDPNRLTGAVAFTVDDGYEDFAEVAAPIFAEFDCPVTVFLPTDFVDGACWMWWDKVIYAYTTSPHYAGDRRSALDNAMPMTRDLRHVTPEARERALARLEERLDVQIPTAAPESCRAMTWDTIRSLEGRGVTFGAHTRTHATLSPLSDEEAYREIVGSWERLNQEVAAASRVFCYPVGSIDAVSDRDAWIVEDTGFIGAVTAVPQHVTPGCRSAFQLPRFGCPRQVWDLRVLVCGLERAREFLWRGE